MTQRILNPILVSIAMAFWGMSFVWSTIVFEYLPPVTTIFFRLVLSSAFLWAWLLLIRKGQLPNRREFGALFILALLQPFLYFVGESFGLLKTTPVVAAIVIALIPVFTPVFAAMFKQDKIGWWNILGVVISFMGVGIIVSSKGFSLEADYIGIAFLLLAVASAITYTLWLRRVGTTLSAINVIAWQNTFGIFMFLPVLLVMDLDAIPLKTPDLRMFLSIGSLALFASSIAFILYIKVVREIGPSRTNVFSNLIPGFTALFAYLILGEHLTAAKMVGMTVVVAGVMVAQVGSLRRKVV